MSESNTPAPRLPRVERSKEISHMFWLHRKNEDPARFCEVDLEKWAATDTFCCMPVPELRALRSLAIAEEALAESGRFYDDLRDKYVAESATFKDALDQIANLGAFIGHPGATPAHTVSETVSLIEKFADAAARTGIRREGRSLSTVAEDAVAKSKRAKPFMESLLAAGRAMGIEFRQDGDGSRILEAIRQAYNESGQQANALRDSKKQWKKRALAAEQQSDEWRQSSETWQKRATDPVAEAPKTFDDLNQEIRKTLAPEWAAITVHILKDGQVVIER